MSAPKLHDKLKTACLDSDRSFIYSSSRDKAEIRVYSLLNKKLVSTFKASNCAPFSRMLIDSDLDRLFATTRNGILLVFDISSV